MLKVTPDDLFFGLGVNRSCHRTSRHMTLYTAAHVRNWLLGVHLMLHYLAMVYQPGIEDLKLTEFSRGFSSERSEGGRNKSVWFPNSHKFVQPHKKWPKSFRYRSSFFFVVFGCKISKYLPRFAHFVIRDQFRLALFFSSQWEIKVRNFPKITKVR